MSLHDNAANYRKWGLQDYQESKEKADICDALADILPAELQEGDGTLSMWKIGERWYMELIFNPQLTDATPASVLAVARNIARIARTFLKVEKSEYKNLDSSQELVTVGSYVIEPRTIIFTVKVNIGLRDSCRLEYEEKVVKVAKIVCGDDATEEMDEEAQDAAQVAS